MTSPGTRALLLTSAFLALAWGFWHSAHFTEISAGVALFLFGMMSLERGFRGFTGGLLERLLQSSTNRLWKSIGFGIASTTLMQSSTLVSLLTISFVSAQMITLAAGIGVILGTNLGTTTGAWLIAGLGLRVDISAYAMPLLVFGVVLLFLRGNLTRGLGNLLIGIGFLFLGIHYMKEGFDAFQGAFDLSTYAVGGVPGLALFIGIGVLITVIMQSSHATLLVVITALAAGQVSYENALALAIGANLGTAVTTALGGMTAQLAGKQLAVAHVLFNVVTALLAVLTLDWLRTGVDIASGLLGIADDDFLLRLAMFHTLFNLLGVVVFAPFSRQFAALLMRHVRIAGPGPTQPEYLHKNALKMPQVAVAAARKEVLHLYENAFGLIAHGLSLRRSQIRSNVSLHDAVGGTRRIFPLDIDNDYEQRIKQLQGSIVTFIGEGARAGLPSEAANQLYTLRQAGQQIVQAVKDMKHLHKNLSRMGLSPKPELRRLYDAIRLGIAEVLREIEHLRNEASDSVTVLSLDADKVKLEKFHTQLSDDIEKAIVHGQINASEATSLMNDAGYAYEIGRRLIQAMQSLYAAADPRLRGAQETVALDDDEVLTAAVRDKGEGP